MTSPRAQAIAVVADALSTCDHQALAGVEPVAHCAVEALLDRPDILAALVSGSTLVPSHADLTAMLDQLVPPATLEEVRTVVLGLLAGSVAVSAGTWERTT